MPDKGITTAYIDKKTSKEISIRAIKLNISRIKLFGLLASIPFKELKELANKYL